MNSNKVITQFNILQIILLHLLPGVPILLIAIVLGNPNWGFGLPFMLAIFLAIPLGLIPVQLLIMSFIAKKEHRKLKESILFTRKMSIGKTVLWIIPTFFWLGFMFAIMPGIEVNIWSAFNNFPSWFQIAYEPVQNQPSLIWPAIICAFLFNGLLGPIVEEFYFRGFLLPRMEKLGKFAPLVNTVLFSLYHLFTPLQNITRVLGMLPYIYTVWYTKNIRIGIVVHCLGNMISFASVAVALLS